MIQKKVCMLGASAVGKTSLVARFIQGTFTEKYFTTMGVKIDRKSVSVSDREVVMQLWDMQGEDKFQKVQMSYLKGAHGYLLVADGTRRDTLDRAFLLQKDAEAVAGGVPFALLVNKSDLVEDWDVEESALDDFTAAGWSIVRTSAKSGVNVDETFLSLATRMLEG